MNDFTLYLKDLFFNTNYGEFLGFLLALIVIMTVIIFIIVNHLSAKHDILDSDTIVEIATENKLMLSFYFFYEAVITIFGIIALLYGLVWLFS